MAIDVVLPRLNSYNLGVYVMPVDSFKWKHYAGEMILLNVRWYLKYALSYRNLEEMMAERGVKVVPLQKSYCRIKLCHAVNNLKDLVLQDL